MAKKRDNSPEQIAHERIAEAERDGATNLNLSGLGLTTLPSGIGRLTSLTRLYLFDNQLTALRSEIGHLTCLTELYLHSNELTALPPEIGRLTTLTELWLHPNKLKALPREIGRLASLTTLYLQDNKLTELPPEIGRLGKLTILALSGNRLTELPLALRDLTALRELYLHGNDALGLPPEVLGPTRIEVQRPAGKKAAAPPDILDYYFRRRGEAKRRLNEAKLLLVGQGGVGKTSLVRFLVENKKATPGEEATEGIDITTWQVASKIEKETIRLNVWDFGGQEIMHATHQFFLTRRSLYLLVLDARKGENEGNIHYWLRIIQSYAGDSPVVVVTNQCDGVSDLDLDERRLRFDYPNIQGFVKTSCTTGRGIEKLREMIASQVNDLPHVFDELPQSYFTIKSELASRAKSRNFLDVRDYLRLCEDNTVTDEAEQQRLLRFLHDLGTVLNYNDPHDPYRLRDTHILNAKWVTDGVYSIVNHAKLKQDHGVLDCDALGDILVDAKAYPPDRRAFIVDMMRRFDLCFDFPDSNRRRVLIPELLPKNEPKGLPWEAKEALRFEYHYKVLPGGLLPRFIVRANHLLGKPPIYWRSGVELSVENCRALIRGDTQLGRVFITIIEGARAVPGQRRRALSVVRDHLRAIHATIPRIEPVEKVPLPDRPDIVADYETLLKMEAAGRDDYWPEGADHAYPVRELLDGVEDARDPAVQERREAVLARGRPADVRAGIYAEKAFFAGDTHVTSDQSRNVNARDIIGSVVNLGEIKDSVVKSIARMPVQTDERAAQLKPLLEKLTDLLSEAPEQGVNEQVAAEALEEVKTIAEAAQKPDEGGFMPTVRKTLRTLRGFAGELESVPKLATQFMGYVNAIAALFAG